MSCYGLPPTSQFEQEIFPPTYDSLPLNDSQIPQIFQNEDSLRAGINSIITTGQTLINIAQTKQAARVAEAASNVELRCQHYNDCVCGGHSWYPMRAPFWSSPTFLVIPDNRRSSRNGNDALARILISIVMPIIIGFAIHALGSAWDRFSVAKEELEKTKKTLKDVEETTSSDGMIQAQRVSVIEIGKTERSIYSSLKNHALLDIVLRVGVIVTAAFTLLSAIGIISPVLMVGGFAATTATTVFAIMHGFLGKKELSDHEFNTLNQQLTAYCAPVSY